MLDARVLAVGVLRTQLRSADVIGRLGGDEFAVLLTATNEVEAQIALERVREALATAMTARSFGVTASIGATVFMTPPTSVEEAMQAADAVMYSVKHTGKNRVRIARRD